MLFYFFHRSLLSKQFKGNNDNIFRECFATIIVNSMNPVRVFLLYRFLALIYFCKQFCKQASNRKKDKKLKKIWNVLLFLFSAKPHFPPPPSPPSFTRYISSKVSDPIMRLTCLRTCLTMVVILSKKTIIGWQNRDDTRYKKKGSLLLLSHSCSRLSVPVDRISMQNNIVLILFFHEIAKLLAYT